jgi:hypothetical protein
VVWQRKSSQSGAFETDINHFLPVKRYYTDEIDVIMTLLLR